MGRLPLTKQRNKLPRAKEAAILRAFLARVYKKTLPYRLLKPRNYDPRKKYPLILFLHGAGERGNENKTPLKNFIALLAQPRNRAKYPCFAVVPQCPADKMWVKIPWVSKAHRMPKRPSEPLRQALALLAALQKEFSLDEKRFYVAGLSMGGYGTWDALSRRPKLFAAAIPICGGADEHQARRIAGIPVWVFHGAKDGAVPPQRSRNIVAALRKARGRPKFTEYPGVGHDSWVNAAAEPELLPWLFGQARP